MQFTNCCISLFIMAVFDDVGTLDHFLSLKLLNSMIHPLCLFMRTVNIVNNLRCLELNVEFRWQKNVKFGKIDKHNSHVSIISWLIEVLFPRQNGSGRERKGIV